MTMQLTITWPKYISQYSILTLMLMMYKRWHLILFSREPTTFKGAREGGYQYVGLCSVFTCIVHAYNMQVYLVKNIHMYIH